MKLCDIVYPLQDPRVLIPIFYLTVISLALSLVYYKIFNKRSKRFYDFFGFAIPLAAGVMGGYWVYSEFVESRQRDWNVELDISHSVLKFGASEKDAVLQIDATLKNIGKRRFDLDLAYGIKLWVEEIDLKKAANSMPQKKEYKNLLLPNVELPKDFNSRDCTENLTEGIVSYYMEPGITYHHRGLIVAKQDRIYSIAVKFKKKYGKPDDELWDQIIVSTYPDSSTGKSAVK